MSVIDPKRTFKLIAELETAAQRPPIYSNDSAICGRGALLAANDLFFLFRFVEFVDTEQGIHFRDNFCVNVLV